MSDQYGKTAVARAGRFLDAEDLARPDVAAALGAVADAAERGLLRECYAETVAPLWLAGRARRFRLYTQGHFCLHKLLNGSTRSTPVCNTRGCLRPPGDDHGELWVDDAGVPQSYVFHPYGLKAPTVVELASFCEEHELDLRIEAASWHFPTETLRVELTKKKTA